MIDRKTGEMLGQMIMVGFPGAKISDESPVVKAIRDFSLGGVVLYNIHLKCFLEAQKKRPGLSRGEAAKICPKNITSPQQLRALTAKLQGYSKTPLLISVDQEGGMVTRLGPDAGFPGRESAKTLGEQDNLPLTCEAGEGIAADLRDCGINLNLAPVVDLSLNPESPIVQNGRSFGADPELVCRHAKAFIQAHRRRGVLTTLKHFPGKGSVGKDTHLEMADVTSVYEERELVPFSRLIGERLADLVMTSHLLHRGWDEEYPATLSAEILGSMLRGKLGYEGVIISDDLLMGGIVREFTLEEACVLAVKAGVDILLASNNSPEGDDPGLFQRIFQSLAKGIEQGRILRASIESSNRRIAALKKRLV